MKSPYEAEAIRITAKLSLALLELFPENFDLDQQEQYEKIFKRIMQKELKEIGRQKVKIDHRYSEVFQESLLAVNNETYHINL